MATNISNMLTLPQEMPMLGMGAGVAARLAMKSAGVDPEDPYGLSNMTELFRSIS